MTAECVALNPTTPRFGQSYRWLTPTANLGVLRPDLEVRRRSALEEVRSAHTD